MLYIIIGSILLYKSFVPPILKYCCTIWSDNLIMYQKEREKRGATKLVKSVTNLPYCDRLKRLGLTNLHYRRLRADVIKCTE